MVAAAGFLAPEGCNPDYDSRGELLQSGDVEENPGPAGNAICEGCREIVTPLQGAFWCAGGCERRSHRRRACSGLFRPQQRTGIWRCRVCCDNSVNNAGTQPPEPPGTQQEPPSSPGGAEGAGGPVDGAGPAGGSGDESDGGAAPGPPDARPFTAPFDGGGGGGPPSPPSPPPRSPRVAAGPSPRNRAGASQSPRNQRKCPACRGRLRATRDPMCCATCGTEYHKKCSGLTRHALLRWSRTRQWECAQCTAHRQQGAVANQPGAPIASGRGAGTDGEGNLLVCQWNVDGMATSLMDLRDLVKRKPATGVILVQESKLLPSDPDPSVQDFPRFDSTVPPHRGGRGGVAC